MPFDIQSAKKLFFDRAAVKNAVDRGTRKALSKFGAFVRTRARSSIRKRKATSKPGSPPSSRTGTLRKLLFFAFDSRAKSVVVGPVPGGPMTGAPERLEYGGTQAGDGRVVWFTNEPGRDARGQFVSNGRRRVVLDGALHYKPRPFMGPAFRAELPKAPQMFKDAIR